VPTLEQVFVWLIGLPSAALYAAAFGFSALENIFPPFPADGLVALCAFVANPGQASVTAVWAFVVAGNVAGAGVTFALGRRYGAAGLRARLEEQGLVRREEKMEHLYERYGLVAIFLARMIPGVRAIVPPFAGAMKLSATRTLLVVGLASAIWYGVIVLIAFRVGEDWRLYIEEIRKIGVWGGAVAVVLVAAAGGIIFWYTRRRRARA
jgi:membrane protein DedA with SNARE-associated domain